MPAQLKKLYLTEPLPELYSGGKGPNADQVANYERQLVRALMEGGRAVTTVAAGKKEPEVDWSKELAICVGRKYVIYDRWGWSVGDTLDNVGWKEVLAYFGLELVETTKDLFALFMTTPGDGLTRLVRVTPAEFKLLKRYERDLNAGTHANTIQDLLGKLMEREEHIPLEKIIEIGCP